MSMHYIAGTASASILVSFVFLLLLLYINRHPVVHASLVSWRRYINCLQWMVMVSSRCYYVSVQFRTFLILGLTSRSVGTLAI